VLAKNELRQIDISAHWSEYAVCNVHNQVMSNNKLMKYLPDGIGPGHWPDRGWYWSILATILPFWSEEYKNQVVN
jgi:hypothetical protein